MSDQDNIPREIIQEVSGFYPLFEVLLKFYDDPITPAVFGVAWRFCQMKDGVCKASLETMADILKVDRSTVMRRLKDLCDDGFLIDTTPDARNVPHVYVDAGRVVMKSFLGVVETVAHRNSTRKSVAQGNSLGKSVAQGNKSVAQSQLIKGSIKDFNQEEQEKIIADTFTLYTNEIGLLTPFIADAIQDALESGPVQWVSDAIREASKNNKRNWAYAEAIFKRWVAQGHKGPDSAHEQKGKTGNGKRSQNNPAKGKGTNHAQSDDEATRAAAALIRAQRGTAAGG